MLAFFENNYKKIVCIFFVVYFLVGIFIYKDYGLAWDDPAWRNLGQITYSYMRKGNDALFSYHSRDHGSIFPVVLITLEYAFKISDDLQKVYYLNHLCTFMLFFIGTFFFYLLCKKIFKDWKYGLLGSNLLILSPRIFAHSFYNAIDISFLAIFIIAIYTLVQYLDKRTIFNTVIHALVSAILMDIRVIGVFIPIITILMATMEGVVLKPTKIFFEKNIKSFIAYNLLLLLFVYLFWPFLWPNPVANFIYSLNSLARYSWTDSVLYMGKYMNSYALPWYYILVWIIITTPIAYIFGALIGWGFLIKGFCLNPLSYYKNNKYHLIFFLWFATPLISVIINKAVLYDEWRHMLFIYPAMIFFSIFGFISLFEKIKSTFSKKIYKIIVIIIISLIMINLLNTNYFMVKWHPYQNIYFNFLAGKKKNIKNNFELDYWGLSYRRALEYIIRNDKRKRIRVCAANYPGRSSLDLLSSQEKRRIILVNDISEANYFISNYRWHKKEYLYKNEVYSIIINGQKIMVVYRFKI